MKDNTRNTLWAFTILFLASCVSCGNADEMDDLLNNKARSGTFDNVGNNGRPSSAFPLGLCEGDCDNDRECSAELKCFQRDGNETVPGCSGSPSRGHDYCYKPRSSGDDDGLIIKGDNGDPSSAFPLGPCEGDCDNNSDCENGLKCFQRNGTQSVPGCDGRGVSGKDYCYEAGGDDADNNGQWTEGDPNIEAEGRFVIFHNGQEKGISCESNGARPKIVSQPRVWRVFRNRRLKDMTSGWELDCPEGRYSCTCRGANRGEWFHGGNDERGTGPVHNSLLHTNQGRPIYPDADGRYIHICLTVDGGYLTAADNDPGVCSRFTFKNWRKIK